MNNLPGKKLGKDFPGVGKEKLNELRGFMEAASGFEGEDTPEIISDKQYVGESWETCHQLASTAPTDGEFLNKHLLSMEEIHECN